MSLGIQLQGACPADRFSSAKAWLDDVSAWVSSECEDLLEAPPSAWEVEGQHGLSLDFHPCAEPVGLAVDEDGQVTLTAMTSSAGPGYHQYVCGFIDELARQFGIAWEPGEERDDETEYFSHRDRQALEEQMLLWLGAVARQLTERAEHHGEGTLSGIAVSMPLDHHFEGNDGVVTPLGPRTRAWMEGAAENAGGHTDFFAWWGEGDTGRTRRDRAVARMWSQVRWCEPRSEEEARAIAMTLRDLAVALEMEPGLEMPWREWKELCDIVGEEAPFGGMIEKNAASESGPLIGYRRRPVRTRLPGGWSIRLPGDFSEMYEEDGAFLAWDASRNIRVSSFSLHHHEEHAGHSHDLPSADDLLEENTDMELPNLLERLPAWADDEIKGVASIYREGTGEGSYRVLMGKAASEGRLALCTVCYVEDADRTWAIDTWKSLRSGV